MVRWHAISCGELQLSVWWKYDHSQRPQANLEGNQCESFNGSQPLAKPQHFPKIIGAAASGWIERQTGKYLQGRGKEGLFDLYTRRGELQHLEMLPVPTPSGFSAEGKYFS